MAFVSYAQNFEDVMLWRALTHVKEGFYIDVGAMSPEDDSISRWFYCSGWRGINIEPNPEFHRQLNELRPKDINLRIALSDQPGEQWMNFFSNPGLSTLDDDIAYQHHKNGLDRDRQRVEVSTLSRVWKNDVPSGQDVHFLKVDVEGLEESVLRGNDWDRNRPWIVVVEATQPMTQIESHKSWEKILKEAGYLFAYADGLNRFYVAKEQKQLKKALKYPPNIYDSFKLVGHQKAEVRAGQAEVRAGQAEVRAGQAEAIAKQAEVTVHNYALQLSALHNSNSWRITAPLRWFNHQLHLLRKRGPKARVKALLRKILLRTMQFAQSQPRLKRLGMLVSNKVGIAERLQSLYRGKSAIGARLALKKNAAPLELQNLTPRARQIYADLKRAIDQHDQKSH